MADSRNQYGANHTDEYGNPIGTNVGATGLHPGVADVGPGHAGATTLQRSGSSSSSSSEDDGQGGRRKKGLKEKIKEKLPGGAHKDPLEQGASTEQGHGFNTVGTTGVYENDPEKKGMVEKIKEKLPGHN